VDIVKTKQFVVCTGNSSLRCFFDMLIYMKNKSCFCPEIYLLLINARACVPLPLILPVITQPCWAKG